MSVKGKLLTAAVTSFVLLFCLNIAFKKKLDKESIQQMKFNMQSQSAYIYKYAPDFEIICLNGEKFKLSEYIGKKVVVINFFTTWCSPCREEMEELQYFVEKMQNKKVKFIAINVGETEEEVKALMRDKNLSFTVGIDRDKKIAAKYRVDAYPTTVVINSFGYIVLYERGAISNADVSLMPIVNRNLFFDEKMAEDILKEYKDNVKDILPECK